MQTRQPILNAPPIIVWSLGLLAAVHLVLSQLPDRSWEEAMHTFALTPARFAPAELHGTGGLLAVTSLFTHQFIHGDWSHLILNGAWLLAFGSAVASRIGTARFLAFALLSGVAGGIAFVALHPFENRWVVGASGALAGLMGGAFRFLFAAFDDAGPGAFQGNQRRIRRMSVAELMRDPRGMLAIGFWVVLNFVTAAIAPLLTSGAGIAWEAHLGGFAFGILAFGLFDRAKER